MAFQLPCSKKYTLTRGKLATFDINDLIKLQGIEEKDKLYAKIHSAKIWGDFNGGSSVTFRTNATITLTGLTFWGLVSGDEADLDVIVSFSQGSEPGQSPHNLKTDDQIARFTKTVRASPNEKFYVDIPGGVSMRENVWNKISFVLKGPPTRVCDGIKRLEKCPESQVEFDFHNSSHQMPEIHYKLGMR